METVLMWVAVGCMIGILYWMYKTVEDIDDDDFPGGAV